MKTTRSATAIRPLLGSIAALCALATTPLVAGEPIFGLNAAGTGIVQFDSTTPGTTTTRMVMGLVGGDVLNGIDFRPATGVLFGKSSGNRLYTLSFNGATVTATQVGVDGAFVSAPLNGFDFNPVPDRIRLVNTADVNLRLNPNDGTLMTTDGTLAFAAGDPNAAQNPNVTGSAYTNNFAGTATTTLYGIDTTLDILVTQNPPNAGTLNTVAPLTLGGVPIDFAASVGFDISGLSTTAYLLGTVGGVDGLYTVNLTAGAVTLVGASGASNGGLAALPLVPLVWDVDGAVAGVGGTGNWDVAAAAANWTVGTTGLGPNFTWPNTLMSDAIFTGTAGAVAVTGAGVQVRNMTFNVDGYSIDGPNTLSLVSAGSVVTVTNPADTATFNASLSGPGALTKAGPGTVVLAVANTYAGGTNLNTGTLLLGNNGALGAGLLTINGGTIGGTENALVIANPIVVDADFSSTRTGAANSMLFQGTVDLTGGARTITNISAGNTALSGVISNGTGLTLATAVGFSSLFQFTSSVGVVVDNTYSGSTTLNGSTTLLLTRGDGSHAIPGDLVLNNGSEISVRSNENVIDTSNVTLNDTSRFVLDFTTSETIATLNSTSTATTVDLTDGALTLSSPGNATYAGRIVGDPGLGTLTKAGTGSQTLTGLNTYQGGTFLNGGTLSFANGSLGSVGTVDFIGSTTLQWNGTNTQDISSRLKVEDGVIATIDTNGKNVTFASALQTGAGASGGLIKTGLGALTLTAINTYTGQTTVNGGALVVNGRIASVQTLVNAGGLLGGSGVIGGNLTNLGTVSPGNSPGVLTVTGNYNQGAGGTLVIEVAGRQPGQFDQLKVGGVATLDGTLRIVNVGNVQLKRGDRLAIVTAGGGVNGEFATIDSDPFRTGTILRAGVTYESNAVFLTALQGSFANDLDGLTRNQKSVARNLDRVVFDHRADKLIDFLNGEPLGNLRHDFDLIAPEELAAIFHIGVSLAKVQGANIQRRTGDIRAGSTGFSASGYSMQGSGPESYSGGTNYGGSYGPAGKGGKELMAPAENRWGVFVTGVGEFTHISDTRNARGYDLTTGGFTLGVDYKVTPNFAIGLSGGYARTGTELDRGRINVDGAKAGLYATYFTGTGFYADAAVSGGYNSYDTRRRGLGGSARGDTEGGEFDALLAAGYDWKSGGLTVGPVASVSYTYVGIDDFQERGSLAPLRIARQHEESFRTTLGAKASYDIQAGGVIIRPEVRAAWQHEFAESELCDRLALRQWSRGRLHRARPGRGRRQSARRRRGGGALE